MSTPEFPYVALTVLTTGIHPATGRIVAIDAVAFNDAGELGDDFHAVLNPDSDPGPRHQHGLTPEEISGGQSFSRILKPLDRFLDGRELIVHDTPYTWGFIVSEARRAMIAAARQNRARNRNRNRGGRRRRQKVGHVPTPSRIIDTLATTYRQGLRSNDIRLAAVAQANGVNAPSPKANLERAQRSERETSRESTELLITLARAQKAAGVVSSYVPDDLRADRFGLQRSHVRVDAAEAPRQHHNPGAYRPGKELRRGMEIVVAPEIEADPDEIIAALTKAELNYKEKLSRETSLVVCNATTDLVGKPMHAQRKDIPLMADQAFLNALERIEGPIDPPAEDKPKGPPQRGQSGKPRPNQKKSDSGRRRRRRGGRGRRKSGGAGKKNTD